MYEVELGVINQADYQYYIEDSIATLNLPSGVSLAATTSGQSLIQSMGTINGQERKSVSWVVKGDKRGTYQLSADFSGILMPFEAPVAAHFEAETTFTVTAGEGIHITVMPESTAYIDEKYYFQYAVTNNSDHPLYNFSTTIGAYQEPDYVYSYTNVDTGEVEEGIVTANYSDPSQVGQAVVVTDGKRVSFDTLYPGQTYYGTYSTTFHPGNPGDDPEKNYYELVEAMAKCISEDNYGVTVSVVPISGHINRQYYKIVEIPTYVGDPIDITTGYFTDELTTMSITGATTLSLDMTYSSGNTSSAGEMGYGWYTDYEMKLEEHNGLIWFYTNPGGIVTFINDNALNGTVYGSVVGDNLNLSSDVTYTYNRCKRCYQCCVCL